MFSFPFSKINHYLVPYIILPQATCAHTIWACSVVIFYLAIFHQHGGGWLAIAIPFYLNEDALPVLWHLRPCTCVCRIKDQWFLHRNHSCPSVLRLKLSECIVPGLKIILLRVSMLRNSRLVEKSFLSHMNFQIVCGKTIRLNGPPLVSLTLASAWGLGLGLGPEV